MTVCSKWHDIIEKVLWTHIAISEKTLLKFCTSVGATVTSIRTFSLTNHHKEYFRTNLSDLLKGLTNDELVALLSDRNHWTDDMPLSGLIC
jgi:hypothetical protein